MSNVMWAISDLRKKNDNDQTCRRHEPQILLFGKLWDNQCIIFKVSGNIIASMYSIELVSGLWSTQMYQQNIFCTSQEVIEYQ